MHIVIVSLFVALVASLLVLAGLWLFTLTPPGRRIEEEGEGWRRRQDALGVKEAQSIPK